MAGPVGREKSISIDLSSAIWYTKWEPGEPARGRRTWWMTAWESGLIEKVKDEAAIMSTDDLLKELYTAADEFRKIEPWTWMYDSDLFGVLNPETNEIGYCTVLGALGEVFAFVIYLGSEGLATYRKMQSAKDEKDYLDAAYEQKCLVASFEDRNSLKQEELRAIKRLGLKFRGRNAWPQFLSYLPGYAPYELSNGEARYLLSALQQAIHVALRFKNDEMVLDPPKNGQLLVRSPVTQGNSTEWKDVWMKPPANKKEEVQLLPVDELLIQRINKTLKKTKHTWEFDSFYVPAVVKEEPRPFFPRMFLFADHSAGIIVHQWVSPPETAISTFQENLLRFFEENKVSPKRVLVGERKHLTMLEPVCLKLGIDLKVVNSLDVIDDFKDAMLPDFLGA